MTSFAKHQWQSIKTVSMNFSENNVPQNVSEKKAGPLLTLPLVCNVIFPVSTRK